MKENKGLNVTPVNAAATDPAALPGLVPSPPEESEEDKDRDKDTDTDEATADNAEEEEAEAESGTDTDADTDTDASDDEDGDGDGDGDAADDDGPVFEAADRRGSVTVDSTGVRFQLDDTEAEFTWPEIGAVEYKTSRFGRRLVLSVHDSRGVCPAEVEAPDKATLKEWTTGLESALDAYFEETSP
ncbi:hypothetical protein [Streptomyces synnematoformans]|uniref:hypothetical protein n=1 Tax=Streptomyces synnematoformans TaxID=415721 RepID=UPI0031D69C9E